MAWVKVDNIKGPQGDEGPPGVVSGVSVASVDPEVPAKATMTQVGELAHLHLELPRGKDGKQGPPGVASSASAEPVPYGVAPEVILSQEGELVHARFRIPGGAPGTNAVPTGEAIGQNLAAAESPARPGLEAGMFQVAENDSSDFSQFMTLVISEAVNAGVIDKVTETQMISALEGKASNSDLEHGLAPKLDRDALPSSVPTAQIRHVEASGYSYEVIRVKGGRDSIKKIEPKAVSDAGTIPLAGLLTPKQMAAESGYVTLVNSDACGGGATQRINGIHIIDGVAKQNFGVQTGPLTGSGIEALLLMEDGSLRPARATDGKTAKQYVEEGAVASFGYGPICVENGVLRDIMKTEFSGFTTELSARTILGQTASGEFVIITVDGKSGAFGIAGNAMGNLALAEGCVTAIVLDGGGTTQTMWRGDLIHPSTDTAGQRTAMSYIAVVAPTANDYDSGPIVVPTKTSVSGVGGEVPLTLRQRGKDVSLCFSAAVAIAADTWVEVSDGPLPARYRAVTESRNRGLIYGTSGAPVGVSIASGTNIVNVRSRIPSLSLSGAEGEFSYEAKFA